jgi:ABC-type siderophore export system fused ATPase/permease subunit
MFGIAMALYVYCQRHSAIRMIRITTQLSQTTRLRLVDKVQAAELPVLERIGKNPIVNALSRDATTIAESGEAMIDGLQAAIFATFAFLYIAWLSLPAFFLTGASAVGAMLAVLRTQNKTQALLRRARATEVEFLNNVNDAIDGFKEARLHDRRREDVRHDVHATADAVTALRQGIEDVHTRTSIMGRSVLTS